MSDTGGNGEEVRGVKEIMKENLLKLGKKAQEEKKVLKMIFKQPLIVF